MNKCPQTRAKRLRNLLAFCRARVVTAIAWVMPHLRGDCCVPIEVLISGLWRRCSVKRRLRRAVLKLQRALGDSFPVDTAVIVQRIVVTERQLAGCYQIGQRSDGTPYSLIRLGLEIDGHSLSADEINSVLAEQCIALAMQQSAPSLLVPIDLHPAAANSVQHPTPLAPDPLAAHIRILDTRGA